MKLGKFEPMTLFEVWHPNYSRKSVLLKAKKVKDGQKYLKIVFTKAPSMEGEWVITRAKAMTFPKVSNGTVQCYEILLKELEILEIDIKDLRGVF